MTAPMPATTATALDPWDALERVRAAAPLVHNITNYVVMNSTANALLAVGASPAMVHAVEEVEDFYARFAPFRGLAGIFSLSQYSWAIGAARGLPLAPDTYAEAA